MSDDLATLQISIKASMADFSSKMGEFEKILKGSEEAVEKVGTSWQETAKGFLVGTFGVEAVKGAFEVLKAIAIDSVKAYDEEAVMLKRVEQNLGTGAEYLLRYSEELEKKTRFTHDDTFAAVNQLTIHKLNREEIEQLLPVIQDYATKSGRDATSTAEAFGRAIEYGATRGLRPFGIEADKTGSQMEIFNELLLAGQGNVKGLAEEVGSIGLGPIIELNNQLAALAETIGKPLAEALNAMMPVFKMWVEGFSELVTMWAHGVSAIIDGAKSASEHRQKMLNMAKGVFPTEPEAAEAGGPMAFAPALISATSNLSTKGRGKTGPKVKSAEEKEKFERDAAISMLESQDVVNKRQIEAENNTAKLLVKSREEDEKVFQKIRKQSEANEKKSQEEITAIDKKNAEIRQNIMEDNLLDYVALGEQMGLAMAEGFGKGAEGLGESLKAMLVTLLGFIQAKIIARSVEIMLDDVALYNFAGFATAAAKVAVITGAFEAAKAGVNAIKFHDGGEVPAILQAGEYVMNRQAVSRYGVPAMEAINQGRAPAGGAVGGGMSATIINTIDPGLMDRYLASSNGQKAIVNIMRAKRYEVNRVLK